MHVRPRLILPLAVAASLGCSGDRATAPNRHDAEMAATEFERVAAELGVSAGPSAVLTYSSAAAALRRGAPVSRVTITVDGATEEWSAFGHEIQFELPPGSAFSGLTPPPPLRALLAWRPSTPGLRVIHLLSADDEGPIGRMVPFEPGDQITTLRVPSFLMYAENRELFWQAIEGRQTSRLVLTGGACPWPPPPRAPNSPAAPACFAASFTFGFSGVQAQPLALRFGPAAPPPAASGTRTLAMPPQAVDGVKLKVTFAAFALPPIASQVAAP